MLTTLLVLLYLLVIFLSYFLAGILFFGFAADKVFNRETNYTTLACSILGFLNGSLFSFLLGKMA